MSIKIKIKNKGTNQKDTIALLANRKRDKKVWELTFFMKVRQGKRQDHETAMHNGSLKKS